MADETKQNVQYFEAESMNALFCLMRDWQDAHEKRFLSLGIGSDGGRFCCIALTNPSEVVITDDYGLAKVRVSKSGSLSVTQSSY